MPRKLKQYANRVKILKYVKVAGSWRFANVVERNGKIVRDHVLISVGLRYEPMNPRWEIADFEHRPHKKVGWSQHLC